MRLLADIRCGFLGPREDWESKARVSSIYLSICRRLYVNSLDSALTFSLNSSGDYKRPIHAQQYHSRVCKQTRHGKIELWFCFFLFACFTYVFIFPQFTSFNSLWILERSHVTERSMRRVRFIWSKEQEMAHTRNLCSSWRRALRRLGLVIIDA